MSPCRAHIAHSLTDNYYLQLFNMWIMNLRSIERNSHTMYRIYANKMHDLISARKFVF